MSHHEEQAKSRPKPERGWNEVAQAAPGRTLGVSHPHGSNSADGGGERPHQAWRGQRNLEQTNVTGSKKSAYVPPHRRSAPPQVVLREVNVNGVIRIMTLNICFKKIELEERMKALAKHILDVHADVVALQEVTELHLQVLCDHLQGQYEEILSDNISYGICHYGVAILHRRWLRPGVEIDFLERQLPTSMDRTLLILEIVQNDVCILAIGCIHLESLGNQATRDEQLLRCRRYLQGYPDNLLLGDFNMRGGHSDERPTGKIKGLQHLLPHHIDVWQSLHPGDPGPTYHTGENWWAKKAKPSPSHLEICRFDRCLTQFSSSRWHPSSIDVVVNSPYCDQLSENGSPRFISDHYGLLLELTRIDGAPSPWFDVHRETKNDWLLFDDELETIDEFVQNFQPSDPRWGGVEWIGIRVKQNQSHERSDSELSQRKAFFKEWFGMTSSGDDVKNITIETLFQLAKKHDQLCGKWLVFVPRHSVDMVWGAIAKAAIGGKLGHGAKVATCRKRPARFCRSRDDATTHIICVYVQDFTNVEDVTRVLLGLRLLGVKDDLMFKADAVTRLGIYPDNQWKIPVSFYKGVGDIVYPIVANDNDL